MEIHDKIYKGFSELGAKSLRHGTEVSKYSEMD